jgi:hypothetical protein
MEISGLALGQARAGVNIEGQDNAVLFLCLQRNGVPRVC